MPRDRRNTRCPGGETGGAARRIGGPPDVAGPVPAESRRGLDRRDFLKSAGFAIGAAFAAGCHRAPVDEAVPFLSQPEAVVPGKAVWYASACSACPAGCGTLVKTRDGRPIKLEGNPDHPLSRGGLCALGQASLLGLYDSLRLEAPLDDGDTTDWAGADREICAALERVAARGGRLRLLTGSLTGPTERAAAQRFLADWRARGADTAWVTYDGLSSSAIRQAHERTHGRGVLPRYRFDRADVVVSFGADFLGTWISPVEHTAGYRTPRPAGIDGSPTLPRPRRHVQLEARMSLTGTNADRRVPLAPGETGLAITHLAERVSRRAGTDLGFGELEAAPLDEALLDELADELWNARGASLVVSGSQDVEVQALVNLLNEMLGNVGETVDLERPSAQRTGDDRRLAELLDELRRGAVDAVVVSGVDPVAELPGGEDLAAALGRAELSVSLADHRTATAAACRFVCPEPHFLETWRDLEPVPGVAVVAQPTIRPLGDTRPLIESLAAWSATRSGTDDGSAEVPSAYRQIQDHWRAHVFPRRTGRKPYPSGDFQSFWDRAVHDGVARVDPLIGLEQGTADRPGSFRAEAVRPVATASRPALGRFDLVLYPEVGILDGRGAENPWLQELPDPVTKVTWGNVASLSPAAADELGVRDGDLVGLSLDGDLRTLELPVRVQPGQHDRVVAVALGYGRIGTARFSGVGPQWIEKRPTVDTGQPVGIDASPWLRLEGGALRYQRTGLAVHSTGRRRELATTQRYDRLEVPARLGRLVEHGDQPREAARTLGLAALLAGENDGQPTEDGAEHRATLWAEHRYDGHHWGMIVDLAACTGCSACVVSCQAENNVPVVGRDEVVREREMHWLRIDRYYTGSGERVSAIYQPMLCQHCDNAPCETVCPVLATVHSSEGLNQQIYNRCVGTRYCANNCPYKVRRFNWFDYPHEDRLQNMVLNPDVVVRSRGVMEKCSLCVQRIQEQKIEAKTAAKPLEDGAIRTACEQSCPARAITFGDLGDPESRVARLAHDRRAYRVLEELNVKPSVAYLADVRNREEDHRV